MSCFSRKLAFGILKTGPVLGKCPKGPFFMLDYHRGEGAGSKLTSSKKKQWLVFIEVSVAQRQRMFEMQTVLLLMSQIVESVP